MQPLLALKDVRVRFRTNDGIVEAVKGIELAIARNEVLAIVGESGSGKSQTMMALMGLLAANGEATGSVSFDGGPPADLSTQPLKRFRGNAITMIFQEPMTSLDPLYRIGAQIMLVIRRHQKVGREEARRKAVALLELVRIPDAARRMNSYPHELSGGQRQRVMIAMALALEPKLLIADEPTTALDVTTQAQILALIDGLRKRHGTAVMFITHDFGVVADIADRIVVMQEGRAVEQGTKAAVLESPQHPYTRKLLAAVPSLTPAAGAIARDGEPALAVEGLSKTYRKRSGWFGPMREVAAASEIGFAIRPGETLGLVGESGSGKSTVARLCLRLIEPDSGAINLVGQPVRQLTASAFRPMRRHVQMVFQDPFASLNPRHTVGRIIAQGPMAHGEPKTQAFARARDLLARVGLPPQAIDRYPHEFSGGQRQRIGIARALALEPKVLIADEPVSALDVSVQAQILDLIRELQASLGLAILFVTHDLRVAAQLCHRVAVMRRGRIVEMAETSALFANPSDDYTRQLLAAVPGRAAFEQNAAGAP